MSRLRQCGLRAALALSVSFAAAAIAGPGATLPDTPDGKLGAALIAHVNSDSPEQIRNWAPTILSPEMDAAAQAGFATSLADAVRDSGGVELTEAHEQRGMLVLTVKAQRGGRVAVFLLRSDAAHPGRLAQAELVPMDDPSLYADWPKTALSRDELKRLVNATLDKLVRANDFSGCLSVADGSETVIDECRGLAERRFGVPVDRQTRFHIGSMGKMFTAVAIAQLVDAGKLSWQDTLAQRVPEYPDQEAAKQITVWQLLHHTAGLGDFFVPEFFQQREKFVNPADYLDLIARQPKAGEPGKDWNYSNAGYVLLGRIVENVSHENYFDYIRRHVFAPAGMTSSGFDTLDDIVPKLAVGYFRAGVFSTEWKADWMKVPFKGSPAGGSYSNTADLLRFARALRAGKLVKPATLAKMFDDAVPAGPGAYAAGFGDRLSRGNHIRGHSGGIEGTDANLAMVWERNADVAVTSNQGPGQAWLLAERIADLLAAEGAKP
ncbi:serine hydrolase domain-containing protein [Tahibacter harae]|uniref:Beta-lactamase family protein n=1 Tax=Tahibacter harae TaxID=2963937 RepID=A0ABT1QUF5_9GAMM|nr:serine hydrolase domain-containing protein [Tahibacter harae]MCQ4165896.1 beta-lactamase family protein [Tahibacter harae]